MRCLSPARTYKLRCPSPCDLLCIAGPRSPSHPCPSSCSRGTKSTAAPCLLAARRPTAPLASTPAPPSPLHLAPHAISRTQGSSTHAKPSVQASYAPSITPIAGRPGPLLHRPRDAQCRSHEQNVAPSGFRMEQTTAVLFGFDSRRYNPSPPWVSGKTEPPCRPLSFPPFPKPTVP